MPTKNKTKPIKKPKKRANKYEEKLQVNGTFEELAKELITSNNQIKNK
ncbi:MAG: hypothetical protein ABIN97_04165 [Ginsengibacter sp.]